jgi:hypothetical protein
MIDKPDRPEPRFPPEKESAVHEAMAAQLDQWGAGPGDLAICGGARGGDVLFAELCRERGLSIRLLVALSREAFVRESVELPGSVDWVARFNALVDDPSIETRFQPEAVGQPPTGRSVFERNNIWMLMTAKAAVKPGSVTEALMFWRRPQLFGLLVWDEQDVADGPGGTAHFAGEIRTLGGKVAIINPGQI